MGSQSLRKEISLFEIERELNGVNVKRVEIPINKTVYNNRSNVNNTNN